MSETLSFRFVGDIYIDREDDPKSAVKDVIDLTTSADVMIGNLERPVCDVGVPAQKPGETTPRRVSPKHLEALTSAGFTAVSLANNHALDYGWEGHNQMRGLLDGSGIHHTGSGVNIAEAHAPAIFVSQGLTCALLSYSSVYVRNAYEALEDRPGLATVQVDTFFETRPRHLEVPGLPANVRTVVSSADRSRVEDDIRQVRNVADIVIVAWHWGISGGYGRVVPYEVDLAHMAIDAGADIVTGAHPHMLHPLELYKGKIIFYSLGDFASDIRTVNQAERESMILEVMASKDEGISSVRVYPTWIEDDAHPVPLSLDDPRTAGILERAGYESNVGFEAVPSGGYFEVIPFLEQRNKPDALAGRPLPHWQREIN